MLEAQRVEAQRQVDELKLVEAKAARDLGFTRVAAPIDGLVANTNLQLGDLVGAGKRLMSIVPLDKVYVDANFKETQIGPLQIGDRATITVDALPGRAFHRAPSAASRAAPARSSRCCRPITRPAISPRSSSACRCASRSIPASAARHLLRPGMSVVVSIDPRAAAQS